MMKTQFLLLCIAIIPAISAWSILKQCPDLPDDIKKTISYSQIQGEWKVLASKPGFSGKCMNITINMNDFTLTKNYYSKFLFFWYKRSSQEYNIVSEIQPVSLDLKPKAWYSFDKEKLYLIGNDYASYVLFYSCTPGLTKYSETYQLWTRAETNPKKLPNEIIERLDSLKIRTEDLTFRTTEDCDH